MAIDVCFQRKRQLYLRLCVARNVQRTLVRVALGGGPFAECIGASKSLLPARVSIQVVYVRYHTRVQPLQVSTYARLSEHVC